MEATFWTGFRLENFMFNNINITSCPAFVGVCFIAAVIAVSFEGSRTVRDWLYLEFLKKRSCHTTLQDDSSIVMHDVKKTQTNGESNQNGNKIDSKNGGSKPLDNKSHTPVIATGTVQGSGKSCRKPGVQVGLLELSFSTFLHMCQVILGYVLMLMVMTFNIWIFVAVLIGTSTGFFIFDSFNKKIHALKNNTASKLG